MKILIFTPQIYLLGGAERLAVELAEELNSRVGVRADILSMVADSVAGTDTAIERLRNNGVTSIQFLGREARSGARGFYAAVRGLRQILVEGNYDVIDTTLLGPSTLACWAVRGLSTRHFSGIHDVFERRRHGSLSHRFWRFSCRRSTTRFYAISKSAADSWICYSGVPSNRVRVIYNSIDTTHFQARRDRNELIRELGLAPERRILLFVGRLALRKGLDTLVEAAMPLLDSGQASLVFVGIPNDPPETAFGETADTVNDLQNRLTDAPRDSVRWLGRREDVPRLMAAADLLVHPARHEGFGLVMAEALAAGLPIVASHVGGIPEVVAGTETVLVAPDEPTRLREAIQGVLNWTPTAVAEAEKKGRIRAEYFRPARRADELLSFYSEVLPRCRP